MCDKTPSVACADCVGWCCYRFWTGDKEALLKAYEDAPADVEFMRENFVLLRRDKIPRKDRRFNYRYTCKAYDADKGSCSRYDDRPEICRKFVCANARIGRVPDRRDFPAQARAMRRAGITPRCEDGRKTPIRRKPTSP